MGECRDAGKAPLFAVSAVQSTKPRLLSLLRRFPTSAAEPLRPQALHSHHDDGRHEQMPAAAKKRRSQAPAARVAWLQLRCSQVQKVEEKLRERGDGLGANQKTYKRRSAPDGFRKCGVILGTPAGLCNRYQLRRPYRASPDAVGAADAVPTWPFGAVNLFEPRLVWSSFF